MNVSQLSDRYVVEGAVALHGWAEIKSYAGGKTRQFVKGERAIHIQFDGNGRIWWLCIGDSGVAKGRRERVLAELSS